MKAVQTTGVLLVGHGAVPKDYPGNAVTRLRTLEAQHRVSGDPPSDEERELQTRLRRWPRTPETDPYQAGLEALASHLRPLLPNVSLTIAYLEFCAPTLEEAVEHMVTTAVTDITVVPSMLTAGGVHSEVDIPTILDDIRKRHPMIDLRYAWPVDQRLLARMLAEQLAAHASQSGRDA
jgi:sirohydrochlorin cobaltochelatase